MNISKVKDELSTYIGKDITIKCNLGRNKFESYKVKIKELYNYVFLVTLIDSMETKSFMYSDIITKTIKIYI